MAIITARLFKNNIYTILIFTWAVLVSYTRIYIGLHYPGDILTGWIWGILSGLAFYQLMVFVQKRYFSSSIPEIKRTAVSRENLIALVLFLVIYVSTILITIDRLTKYLFFTS